MKSLTLVKRLLAAFVSSTRKVTVSRYPREYLAMEQVCLAAVDLQQRIERRLLAYDHIREHFENLCCLYELMIVDTPFAASYLAELVKKLAVVMSEVCPKLEMFARQRVTQWHLVMEQLKCAAAAQPIASSMIPTLSLIQAKSLLGCGGFGSVYKAVFGGQVTVTLKIVPIKKFKVLKHACVDKVFASLGSHPFVVRQYSMFQCDQAYITLMEYIRGIDLSRVVHADTRAPLDEAACQLILAQLGIALQHIHRKGFIHRDIKPSNLLVTPLCRVTVIDFDTGKISCGKYFKKPSRFFDERNEGEFFDRETAGTVPFFSPEVLNGTPYSRPLDWWAVGISAFNMAYGKLPWKGDKKDNVFKDKVSTAAVPHDSSTPISDQFANFIDALLIKNPKFRLCSAGIAEFQEHAFFDTFNWAALKAGTSAIELDAVKKAMQMNTASGLWSAPTTQKKKAVVELATLKDCKEHFNLNTFATPGFQRCLSKILKSEPFELKDLLDQQDKQIDIEIGTEREGDDKIYRFEDFTKRVSKKKEAIQKGVVVLNKNQ